MSLDHLCRKKDKRLLVLLALGFLIMFSNIEISMNAEAAIKDFSWLEIQGKENRLYRFELTDHSVELIANGLLTDNEKKLFKANKSIINKLNQGRAITFQKEQEQYVARETTSPRLSFFLGQPFSINTATIDDLTLLSGIGPALAGNIISYRENYGLVTSAYLLEEIPGIGPRMKQRLQKYFTYSHDSQ